MNKALERRFKDRFDYEFMEDKRDELIVLLKIFLQSIDKDKTIEMSRNTFLPIVKWIETVTPQELDYILNDKDELLLFLDLSLFKNYIGNNSWKINGDFEIK